MVIGGASDTASLFSAMDGSIQARMQERLQAREQSFSQNQAQETSQIQQQTRVQMGSMGTTAGNLTPATDGSMAPASANDGAAEQTAQGRMMFAQTRIRSAMDASSTDAQSGVSSVQTGLTAAPSDPNPRPLAGGDQANAYAMNAPRGNSADRFTSQA